MNPGLPVPPECAAARELLLDRLGARGETSSAPAGFHCEACRAFFERATAHASAISSLPRVRTDWTALGGLVVAGLNAGRRQERAAQAVGGLERIPAPERLAQALEERLGGVLRAAPRELDQRVRDEMLAGAALRAERHLGSLARRSAPKELDALVERNLARPRGFFASRGLAGLARRRWLAAAAVVTIVAGAVSLARRSGMLAPEPELKIVHADSLASLGTFASGFFAGVTGYIEPPRASDATGTQGERR